MVTVSNTKVSIIIVTVSAGNILLHSSDRSVNHGAKLVFKLVFVTLI